MAKFARRKNVAKKNKHAAAYKRAQERKAANIKQQEANRKINESYRAKGEPTPYQERKREKFLRHISNKYGTAVDKPSPTVVE